MRLSLIVSVLESYEVVRRQLLHLGRILPADCELILVDDGSVPPLRATCEGVPAPANFVLHATNDFRPWTQARARNAGADLARADRLVFFDVDHVLTADVLRACAEYPGDKLHWVRRPGVLDDSGRLVTDPITLVEYGMTDPSPSIHVNSFMIRRSLFRALGGYDERFAGRYGGEDIDLNDRYRQLCRRGVARPEGVDGAGYVFPNPARDVKRLFHSLSRECGAS
jgi:glycosyltransferase involved in cell wall biosynthesis